MSRLSLRSRARGFTLVELLVVIAIIGVLVALLLPAVQQARESSRRTSCVNNLKQLATAIHNYHDTMNTLPSAGIVTLPLPSTTVPAGPNFSWVVLILPFLEQGNLHDQFDFESTVFNQSLDPQERSIPSLLCPSDGARNRVFSNATLTSGKRFAKANYATFVSPVHAETLEVFSGALIVSGPRPLSKVSDGTSSTLMLSEVRTRDNQDDQRGAWALPWIGATWLAYDMHDVTNTWSAGQYSPAAFSIGMTQPPNNQGPNLDMIFNCSDPVGAQMLRMPCNNASGGWLSAAPRSLHRGGVLGAFVDGRVEFIPNSIDPYVMAYLVCAHDEQVVAFP